MSTLLKKFVLIFLSFAVLFTAIAPNFSPVKAATSDLWIHQWYGESDVFSWYKKVYDESTSPSNEIFGERYTAAQVQWVVYGLFSMIWNFIPGNPELTTCLVGGNVSGCVNGLMERVRNAFIADSHVSNMASAPGGMFSIIGQNPISGVYYFKNLASKFSLVGVAHAQGYGFTTAGNSMVALWKITRDLSYGLIILAAIVLAFMIMFRVKISPQVVISVQSAIPKLVIALVLITFSYAIAGLAIDLMYVVIGLIAGGLSSSGLSTASAVNLFNDFTNHPYSAVGLLYLYWFEFIASAFVSIFNNGGNFVLGILTVVFAILSILGILIWTVKIIIELVKNFALLMLTIAIGPLEILLGTVTGSSGFGSWFKKLISYLAVYPVMCLMFFFAFFFLHQGGSPIQNSGTIPFLPTANIIGDNTWLPPLSTIVASGDNLMWIFVSFFIFSEITHVSKIVQGFVSGKPFAFGTGIGEAFGPAKGIWNNTGGVLVQGYQRQKAEDFARNNEIVRAFEQRIRDALRIKSKPSI